MDIDYLINQVQNSLSDELRKPPWRGMENPYAGHCYVASEALYYLLGGKESGWKPMFIRHEDAPHWFLAHEDGTIIDPTSDQFESPIPYDQARGKGFLTRDPSARAQTVIDRVTQDTQSHIAKAIKILPN